MCGRYRSVVRLQVPCTLNWRGPSSVPESRTQTIALAECARDGVDPSPRPRCTFQFVVELLTAELSRISSPSTYSKSPALEPEAAVRVMSVAVAVMAAVNVV